MATLVVAYKSYGKNTKEFTDCNTTSRKTNLNSNSYKISNNISNNNHDRDHNDNNNNTRKNNSASVVLTPKALLLLIFFFKCVLQVYVVLLSI